MSAVLDELSEKVALMRKLGIQECDGIKLGVAPSAAVPKEETADEWRERLHREAKRHHDIMFAASLTRPAVRRVK